MMLKYALLYSSIAANVAFMLLAGKAYLILVLACLANGLLATMLLFAKPEPTHE